MPTGMRPIKWFGFLDLSFLEHDNRVVINNIEFA